MVITFLCKVFVWLIFLNDGLSFFTSAVWKEDFIEAWISLFIVQKLHKLIHCQVRFFLCTTEKTVSTKLVTIHIMFLIHCTASSFLQVNNYFSAHSKVAVLHNPKFRFQLTLQFNKPTAVVRKLYHHMKTVLNQKSATKFHVPETPCPRGLQMFANIKKGK